ncbi:MAG: hypothetical protein JST00_34120 [Deltaproteobacteria bacterium]|nr:hypothetical protein [Deltaproteobacteria bacterium]
MNETEIATGRCVVCRVYVERADLRKTADGMLHCVACPPPKPRVRTATPVPDAVDPSENPFARNPFAKNPFAAMTWPPGFRATAYVIAATVAACFIAACASQS